MCTLYANSDLSTRGQLRGECGHKFALLVETWQVVRVSDSKMLIEYNFNEFLFG